MSDFEFLSVLVSIVIGFGLTHLLGGLGRAYFFRDANKMDAVHVGWTITVFFVLILNWWIFLLWRDFDAWTFTSFFMIILWTTSMYVMALALYPPGRSGNVDYRILFERNRSWFYASLAIMCLLDLWVTYTRDHGVIERNYLAFVGHYAVIAATGIFVKKRLYDLVASWYLAITMALWSFGVRHTLF
ncbi:MAG: hypothetical protein R3192_10645 [Woeseiaceae bacterium]|nr:hypothetical protein [Woeseiaceae bacterium]